MLSFQVASKCVTERRHTCNGQASAVALNTIAANLNRRCKGDLAGLHPRPHRYALTGAREGRKNASVRAEIAQRQPFVWTPLQRISRPACQDSASRTVFRPLRYG